MAGQFKRAHTLSSESTHPELHACAGAGCGSRVQKSAGCAHLTCGGSSYGAADWKGKGCGLNFCETCEVRALSGLCVLDVVVCSTCVELVRTQRERIGCCCQSFLGPTLFELGDAHAQRCPQGAQFDHLSGLTFNRHNARLRCLLTTVHRVHSARRHVVAVHATERIRPTSSRFARVYGRLCFRGASFLFA